MNAAALKPQPLITFIVVAVHPDAEDVFVRVQASGLSRFDAREDARRQLRAKRIDHWQIASVTAVA